MSRMLKLSLVVLVCFLLLTATPFMDGWIIGDGSLGMLQGRYDKAIDKQTTITRLQHEGEGEEELGADALRVTVLRTGRWG